MKFSPSSSLLCPLLCPVLVAFAACCSSASATEAGLILVNAKVFTENPAQPAAEAVALDGPTILAVGDNAAIRKLAGPHTRIIDLGGRLLLPGFNDAHVHFLIGGASLTALHLGAAAARPSSGSASPNTPKPCPGRVAARRPLGPSALESAPSAQPPAH